MWRARFWRRYGPVVRNIRGRMNEWMTVVKMAVIDFGILKKSSKVVISVTSSAAVLRNTKNYIQVCHSSTWQYATRDYKTVTLILHTIWEMYSQRIASGVFALSLRVHFQFLKCQFFFLSSLIKSINLIISSRRPINASILNSSFHFLHNKHIKAEIVWPINKQRQRRTLPSQWTNSTVTPINGHIWSCQKIGTDIYECTERTNVRSIDQSINQSINQLIR